MIFMLSAGAYQWQLSLLAGALIVALSLLARVLRLVPAIGQAHRLNAATLARKMERASYAANHAWNRKWSGLYVVAIFGGVVPFCLTLQPTSLWRMGLDVVVILMVYDFFYYLMHRFLFHDSRLLGGPLKRIHAVHHRQHNPCRQDASYIHPAEVALGLGLYIATVFMLSRIMGAFHVATFVVTFVAFMQINLHNHSLWESDRFPFRYLHYLSRMHHNHHARFDGGNFATISLLYDWLFGTLDDGDRRPKRSISALSRAAAKP